MFTALHNLVFERIADLTQITLQYLVQQLPQNFDAKQALLDQLVDSVEPLPISIWPLAIGWWYVIGFILFTSVIGAIAFYQIKQSKDIRLVKKSAFDECRNIETLFNENQDTQALLLSLTLLTKKIIATRFKNFQPVIAQLNSNNWWFFLDNHIHINNPLPAIDFDQLYQATNSTTAEQGNELIAYVKNMINHIATKSAKTHLEKVNSESVPHFSNEQPTDVVVIKNQEGQTHV